MLLEHEARVPLTSMQLKALTSFIQDSGFGGEPAIVAVQEGVRHRVGRHESIQKVVIQAAPVHSHQSLGTSERRIQTVRAQMRDTLVTVATGSWHRTSSVVPSAVRHAAWLHCRFHKRQDKNLTQFEMAHLKKYNKTPKPVLL